MIESRAGASTRQLLTDTYRIPSELIDLLELAEGDLSHAFAEIDKIAERNQLRLLSLYQKRGVTDYHLNGSTGYGYNDPGREALEDIYAEYFGCAKALVRSQIVSGTHALAIGLFACLRPGDRLISAVGTPYDTLLPVIGAGDEDPLPDSLAGMGVLYEEIPLRANECSESLIDTRALLAAIDNKTKLVLFQRSKGYSWRPALTNAGLKIAIRAVKSLKPDAICLVDNCYCEMTDISEPGEVGADLVIGSLIKNPGGTLAPCGGYIAGNEKLIEACVGRLLAPGLRPDMGASLGFQRLAFQGLFQAPSVVGQSLKGARLAAEFFHRLGYPVMPQAVTSGKSDERSGAGGDIVQAIRLGAADKLKRFCGAIQMACPVDSSFAPEPSILPGYSHEIIMAGGGFVQGSSSELSADGPMRAPYIAYLQGGFSLSQIKLGLLLAAKALISV